MKKYYTERRRDFLLFSHFLSQPAIRSLSTHLQNAGAAFESQLREWSERKAQIETESVGARQKPQRVPSAGTAAVTDLVREIERERERRDREKERDRERSEIVRHE
jgi:hypothetical protein